MSVSSSFPESKVSTIVISGGGAKGILALGGLHYLEEKGILSSVTTYVGTSVGSIISYLLIIGYTALELITKLCTSKFGENPQLIDILNILENKGAISYEFISEFLTELTIEKGVSLDITLKELSEKFGKKLIVVTYNLSLETIEYLSSDSNIPCLTALRMSSNLPLIFSQFFHDGFEYVDGGLADNFPIKIGVLSTPLDGGCIGFFMTSISLDKNDETLENSEKDEGFTKKSTNLIQHIYKLMSIPINQGIQTQVSDVKRMNNVKVVELKQSSLSSFKFNLNTFEKLELFSSGYNQTKNEFS